MQLSPAEYVISIFKGVRATARAIGRAPASVSNWRRSVKEGGTGGQIPSAAQRKILQLARIHKLDITPNDLAFGRDVKTK